MAAIVKAAFKAAPNVDRSGLRARMVWSARDAQNARTRERDNAIMSVRWAARPMIAAKKPPADIMAAARLAGGDMMQDHEILPILADEWNRAHMGRK